MSYASLVETLPGTLRSSTGLAALASLGIHGLLWAVLPVLPFESKSLESKSQRSVGLIALTPEEQSRLPSTSEVTLPPFATQPSILPPLPPPPFQTNVLPPLSVLPPFQLAPNNLPKNSLKASSPQTKTFRVRSPAPTQNNRLVPSRIATNKPAGSVANRTYYSDELLSAPRTWTPPLISGLPTNRLTPQPFDSNAFPPSPPIVPLPSPPPLGQQNTNLQNTNPPQDQQVAIANQPTPSAPNAPQQKVPERTKRELLARRDQLATNRARRSLATPSVSMTKEQLVQALRRSPPQPNPASSELATAQAIRQLDEYKAQRQKVQEDNPKVVTKAPISEKIATCEKQLDGSAAYINAVVNPQGKVVSGPTLYSKTGSVDTQQAMARVRSYPFRATGNTISYDFAIRFKYDTANCSEPTPEPTPEDTQTQQSNL